MAAGFRIFISYRRQDSGGYAQLLYKDLRTEFPDQVFRDIDSLILGEDFVERIEKAVAAADVLVCVIGRDWVSAVDEQGQRRLDDPDDFVRLEVGAALKRNISVIPVLVGGAPFPKPEELPEDLARLRRRNGLVLTDVEWEAGFGRLSKAIEHVLGVAEAPPEDEEVKQVVEEVKSAAAEPSQPPPPPPVPTLSGAVLPLALGGAALLTVGLFMKWDHQLRSFVQNNFGGALEHGGVLTGLAAIAIVVAAVLGALLVHNAASRAIGAGVLIGAGVAGAAKYLHALQAGAAQEAHAGVMFGVLGALVGSGLLVAAGLLADRTADDVARTKAVGAATSAIAGAVVMMAATAVPFNGGGSSGNGSKAVARSFNEAVDPILTSVAIVVIAALLLRPWRHVELSAALLTLGCIDALLWFRYLAVPLLEDSSVGSFGPGGLVGLLGAGLVVLGGFVGLHGSRAYETAPVPSQP